MPYNGLVWGKCQYLAHLDVRFVPLEYKRAVGFKDAEGLRKALAYLVGPIVVKRAVFKFLPRPRRPSAVCGG